MSVVREKHVTNTQIRKKFGNINSLAHIMKHRMLKFVGRTLRQDPTMLSRTMCTSFIPEKLIRGRPFRTNRDAIAEAIRALIPSTPESNPLMCWAGCASDRITWEIMIKSLFKRTYPPFFAQGGCNTRSRSNHFPQSPPRPTHPSSSPDSEPNSSSHPPTPPRTFHNNPQSSPTFDLNSNRLSRAEARNTLNVSVNASRREISLKFKILSRKYHPDKWSPDSKDSYSTRTKKFQIIANARALLVS